MVKVTVQEVLELDLWDKVCKLKGWDIWDINKGIIKHDEIVEVDKSFLDGKIVCEKDNLNVSVDKLKSWIGLIENNKLNSVMGEIKDIINEVN